MSDHIRSEDLAAYVDGLLNAAKKSDLEKHFSHCPACLDELAEITAIQRGRDHIPAYVLQSALGKINKTAKPPLQLRLVFEIAAAVMVVVFIGYLFLSGNRFWQPAEQQKPSVLIDENILQPDDITVARDRKAAPQIAPRPDRGAVNKSKIERNESDAYSGFADTSIPDKIATAAADKDSSAVSGKSLQASEQGDNLHARIKEQPPPATKRLLQKKEATRTATATQSFGEKQMEFAAKGQPAGKVMETKGTAADQNLERQNEPGSGAAPPSKEAKLNEEELSKKNSVAVPATIGNIQSVDAEKKREVILKQKGIADMQSLSPVRIEGEVDWSSLRNPGQLSAWSWFPKDLTLELQIDATGAVITVVPLGKIDPTLAKQAENEAKKLLFSVSKKKLRQARLIAE